MLVAIMVSGTESRPVFMDADDMAAGIVGMFALSPSAAETATGTETTRITTGTA